MVRESAWRIVFDPEGVSPLVLIDYGQLMPNEVAGSIQQAMDIGRFDFAVSAQPRGRGNRRRRLNVSRIDEFQFRRDAWQAMITAMRSDPWGVKALLSITPYGVGPKFFRAAILSVSRSPIIGDIRPGVLTRYAVRIDAGLQAVGPGYTIIDGYYTPPISGGGSGSGGIIVVIPPGSGIQVGDTVEVTGVPGVKDGQYTVSSVSSGSGGTSLGIKAPSDQEPKATYPAVRGISANGQVTARFANSKIYITGCNDGASYQYSITGRPGLFAVHVDSQYRAEIDLGALDSVISYVGWPVPDPSPDPLPITGEDVPTGGLNNQVVTEHGPTGWSVALYRNNLKIDDQEIKPAWQTSKQYDPANPVADHIIARSPGVSFTLRGPGNPSGNIRPTGIPGKISGGTVKKTK